ncbi:hypothetical protein FRC20_009982 [Serendipita sp. 405]|nr:hypothetical protein FRC20_009982 [Serendipita sp. 405]
MDILRRVANESMSTRNVRLTCRYWRDLVASDRILPRKIVMQYECDSSRHSSRLGRDHCVHSARQLARALELVRDAHFHFHIQIQKPMPEEDWDIVPWNRFTAQCSGLFLARVVRESYPTLATILTKLPPLHSLRHLSSQGDCLILPAPLTTEHQPVPIHILSLQSLSWIPKGYIIFNIEPIKYLLTGITRLELIHPGFDISINFLVGLFSSCTNLEDLTWFPPRPHPEDLKDIRRRVKWQSKLRELRITHGLLSAFPPLALRSLTSLSETSHSREDKASRNESTVTEDDQLHLPRLVDLTMAGTWSDLLHIKAPNLHQLHLSGNFGSPKYVSQMDLTPYIVDIEDWESGEVIKAFLGRAPIPNLVEIQMHVGIWACGDGLLAQLLTADIGKQSSLLFPCLKCLLVKLRKWCPQGLDVTTEEKRVITEGLSGLPYSVILC